MFHILKIISRLYKFQMCGLYRTVYMYGVIADY